MHGQTQVILLKLPRLHDKLTFKLGLIILIHIKMQLGLSIFEKKKFLTKFGKKST